MVFVVLFSVDQVPKSVKRLLLSRAAVEYPSASGVIKLLVIGSITAPFVF